jgi:hypothetical protein
MMLSFKSYITEKHLVKGLTAAAIAATVGATMVGNNNKASKEDFKKENKAYVMPPKPAVMPPDIDGTEARKVDSVGERLVPYLKEKEGWRSKVYKDSKGNPTVGHGALVDSTLSKTLTTVFPDQHRNWVDNITSGRDELSKEQGHQLLSHQATIKFNEARAHVGEERFDSLSHHLQSHLAAEHFRGMLKKSPKVLKMLRSGNFKGASTEYLNADDYRNNLNNSIGKRMKDLSDALAQQ